MQFSKKRYILSVSSQLCCHWKRFQNWLEKRFTCKNITKLLRTCKTIWPRWSVDILYSTEFCKILSSTDHLIRYQKQKTFDKFFFVCEKHWNLNELLYIPAQVYYNVQTVFSFYVVKCIVIYTSSVTIIKYIPFLLDRSTS